MAHSALHRWHHLCPLGGVGGDDGLEFVQDGAGASVLAEAVEVGGGLEAAEVGPDGRAGQKAGRAQGRAEGPGRTA